MLENSDIILLLCIFLSTAFGIVGTIQSSIRRNESLYPSIWLAGAAFVSMLVSMWLVWREIKDRKNTEQANRILSRSVNQLSHPIDFGQLAFSFKIDLAACFGKSVAKDFRLVDKKYYQYQEIYGTEIESFEDYVNKTSIAEQWMELMSMTPSIEFVNIDEYGDSIVFGFEKSNFGNDSFYQGHEISGSTIVLWFAFQLEPYTQGEPLNKASLKDFAGSDVRLEFDYWRIDNKNCINIDWNYLNILINDQWMIDINGCSAIRFNEDEIYCNCERLDDNPIYRNRDCC